MVTDLKCTDCGAFATYADAYVFDTYKTCIGDTEHEWVEPMNSDIDIVS
jgi:hypothetical protein